MGSYISSNRPSGWMLDNIHSNQWNLFFSVVRMGFMVAFTFCNSFPPKNQGHKVDFGIPLSPIIILRLPLFRLPLLSIGMILTSADVGFFFYPELLFLVETVVVLGNFPLFSKERKDLLF